MKRNTVPCSLKWIFIAEKLIHVLGAGLTLFRGIRAIDRDKPNTPNSDVQFAIIAGNERGKFALESSQQPDVLLRKSLDFDAGDREFLLTVAASVSPNKNVPTIHFS